MAEEGGALVPAGAARPRAREPLSRARALAAAMVVADAEGLGALTMRRLARERGVEAMSLYHHVRNKDDLLDAMVEAVFAEMALPRDDEAWAVAMRRRACSVREVLTRHPWAIAVVQSRTSPGPATLGHLDALLRCCRRAGFSVALTAHAASLVDSYVYGFVLQEVNLPAADTGGVDAVIEGVLPDLATQHPALYELTVEHVLQPGYRYGDEFDHGLGLVLEALEAAARREAEGG